MTSTSSQNNTSLEIEARDYYRDHFVEFCQDEVGVILDDWQMNAYEMLMKNRFLAVRSGSGVGKTKFLSLLVLWFLAFRPYAKVPCTASNQHQLFDLLWSECSRNIDSSKFLKKHLEWTQTRIGVKGYEASWYAVARTATVSSDGVVAEGLQGFHSDDGLLFVVDEASGIADSIFPAIEGAFTGDNCYCVMTSNPTRLSGYFYDIFHTSKTGAKYAKVHVSCLDSPRVSKSYIEMMQERYGEDHPVYRFKVLGEFAEGSDERLVPFDFIEQMRLNVRESLISDKMPVEIGIDIGRSRAASIACVRQGFNILAFEEFTRKRKQIHDTIDTVGWIETLINLYDPEIVRLDANGIGVGVYDILHKKYGDMIVAFIGQAKAQDNLRYANLRAEAAWILRDKISSLWCKCWPDRFLLELSDICKKPAAKFLIESKDEMLKRSKRSPDYFDSAMYAYANNSDPIISARASGFCSSLIAANNDLIKLPRGFDLITTGWHQHNFRFR